MKKRGVKVPLAYGLIAFVSLCMVGVCVAADKKRDVWLLLVFVSVSICNLGYFMVSISKELDAALNANRIAYLGSVFLPYFLLMMVLRFCSMKRSKLLMVSLGAVGFIMLAITTSPGILPIYYSSVDIEIVDGATKLIREYGPTHLWYYVYLFGYMISMVVVTICAISKKMIQSRLHTVLLLCAVFCNIVIWLVEQFLPRGFEWLSVSYILTEVFMLAIYHSMQRQNLMDQSERTQTYSLNVLLAVFLLLFANTVRVVTIGTEPVMYIISHVVVLVIYLGILTAWSVSVYDRIINRAVRRHLICLVGLMVFWILMRTLRHTVFYHIFPVGQWCWYAYYISMILIPQVFFLAAKYIGKPEGYRLPRKWYLMYIPSIVLILGILTNDLHQLAFRFPMGHKAGWDIYEHTFLYFAAVVWIFACIAAMIAVILKQCRVPGNRKMIWMPIAMLSIGLLYTILYSINSNIFGFIEVTASLCFIAVAIWESIIKTGLIQSNARYTDLLKQSQLGVLVTDHDGMIHYRSDDVRHLTKEQIRETQKAPVLLENGIRVSGSRIRGGRVLWQEDISELLDVLEELKELHRELADANAVSMQNYKMDKKIRILTERNRLHDELHRQTAPQIDKMNHWLQELSETTDAEEKKDLLRHIVVAGAYLKRRNNLILVNEQDGIIKREELRLSVEEMMKNLKLVGIECACTVEYDRDLPANVAMRLFDFYEYVTETTFDSLSSLLARFFFRDGCYYACIDAVCMQDLTRLQTEEISVSMVEENCYTISLKVEGGDGR